jgi:hypothetical protein
MESRSRFHATRSRFEQKRLLRSTADQLDPPNNLTTPSYGTKFVSDRTDQTDYQDHVSQASRSCVPNQEEGRLSVCKRVRTLPSCACDLACLPVPASRAPTAPGACCGMLWGVRESEQASEFCVSRLRNRVLCSKSTSTDARV